MIASNTPVVAAEFFAACLIAGIVLVVAALLRPESRAAVAERAPALVAVVAVGATAGSLYFSEIADFVPCELCWYQRIAMYPIAVVAILAVIRRERHLLPYVAVLAVIGAAISAYHVGIQWFPDQSTFCDASNPCSARWVEAFGRVTIPQMAGLSFGLVALLAFSGSDRDGSERKETA